MHSVSFYQPTATVSSNVQNRQQQSSPNVAQISIYAVQQCVKRPIVAVIIKPRKCNFCRFWHFPIK